MASKKPTAPGDGALKHNPFAALEELRTKESVLGSRAEAPASTEQPQPSAAPAAPTFAKKSRGRLLQRRETKHRGGKAVVVVSGFEALREFDREAVASLAKELKQALGCGGTVETSKAGCEIVLQGDRPAKVAELLRARGFRVDGVTT